MKVVPQPDLALRFDVTAVVGHDALGHHEPETAAATGRLGAEERREDLRQIGGGDPAARVGHADFDLARLMRA